MKTEKTEAEKLLKKLQETRISTYYKSPRGVTIHFNDRSFLDIITDPGSDDENIFNAKFNVGMYDDSRATEEDPLEIKYEELPKEKTE